MIVSRLQRAAGPLPGTAFDDLYRSRQGRHDGLKRMVRAGDIEVIGEVMFKGQGKPALVYALPGTRVKKNQLRHETCVSLVIDALGFHGRRAPDTDPELRQDAVWPLPSGEEIDFEVDTGSVAYAEVEDRMDLFKDSESVQVWVSCGQWGTNDLTRLNGLRSRAIKVRNIAWFVTLGEVLAKKENAVLSNFDGEVVTFAELARQLTYPETNRVTNGPELSD